MIKNFLFGLIFIKIMKQFIKNLCFYSSNMQLKILLLAWKLSFSTRVMNK